MTVGMRHDDLRRRNRAMVIAAARRGGQVSRTEITTITGLSHSTISAISADLIAEGILAEARQDDAPALRRGRPQIGLELDPAAASVVTLMLSLNSLSAVRLDYSGAVLDEEQLRLDTRALSREALIGECVAVLQRCLAHPAAIYSAINPQLQHHSSDLASYARHRMELARTAARSWVYG